MSKKLFIFSVVLIQIVIFSTIQPQLAQAEEEYSYPVLRLDEPLEYFVPRNISLKMTAFSSSPGVLIRADVYDYVENRTYQLNNYYREYIVNERLFFNASILQEEKEYELILWCFDNEGRNTSIRKLVQIDPIPPRILDVTILETELYLGQSIDISYTVEDDHFKAVYVFISDADWYITSNHAKQGTVTLHDYFFWLPSGYTQYSFDCRLVATDWAGNNVSESFTITYIDDRQGGLSEEETNKLILNLIGNSAIIFGSLGLVLAMTTISVGNKLEKRGV